MSVVSELRKFRICDYAVFDFAATFAGAVGITYMAPIEMNAVNLMIVTILLIVIGIMLHIATDTPTMLNYNLGLGEKPYRESPK